MSTSSSVRRLKDRGGAGARTSAAKTSIKPLTPLSSSKENIRPYSRISDPSRPSVPFPTEKPFFRAVPRASSVPKGRARASSPLMRPSSVESGKSKIGSVSVGAAGPRVSLDGDEMNKEKLSGGGVRVLTDLKDKVRKRSGLCESGDGKSGRADGGPKDSGKAEALSSEKFNLELRTDLKVEKGRNAAGERVPSQVLQRSTEKESDFTGYGNGKAGVKYPSKLHEKLAFLEGKVKRIASDIKRTKEMLDQTNPDNSKCVLSDIQEKISGIEKAMNDDVGIKSCNSEGKKSSLKENGSDVLENVVETGRSLKCSVRGMNNEELEARLFPHHMLLRNRKSSSVTVPSSSESVVDCVEKLEVAFKLKDKENSARSFDENAITSEFLESLEDQLRISKDDVKNGVGAAEVQETDGVDASSTQGNVILDAKVVPVISLMADETLDEYDDQENRQDLMVSEEKESPCSYFLSEIGKKISTGGWFVSDGEAVLLAHNDGSCSYHDIVNSEEKAEYRPPASVSPGMWRDCWIIRAPSADGCSGRYVVAASAGNALEAGFCSWDFYTKDLQASHVENDGTSSRNILGPLPNNSMCRRNVLSTLMVSEPRQWWYKPCGPLMVSMATSQRIVRAYDIRDGEQVLKWEVQKPVAMMDHSSPLHWRSRGKVVVAESEVISLWDVNALTPQALLSVPLLGQKLSALHVNNADAEVGGGVRQRISSLEAEGNDGVYCCGDSINVLDFRNPSGIGLRIQKLGVSVQSVFSRGDSVYIGCSNPRTSGKKNSARPEIQQFSLCQQSLFSAYSFPESNDHPSHAAITQVWGNSSLVMGVNGQGLFMFDATKDDVVGSFLGDQGITSNQKAREVIGPDDLYTPSFDYASPRALLISRDRPAMWRCLT